MNSSIKAFLKELTPAPLVFLTVCTLLQLTPRNFFIYCPYKCGCVVSQFSSTTTMTLRIVIVKTLNRLFAVQDVEWYIWFIQ